MTPLVRIATTSIATLEAVAPPYNLRTPDPEATFRLGLDLVASAGRQGAELVCLPEVFAHAGVPVEEAVGSAQDLEGSWVARLAESAREAGVHLVAGAYVRGEDGISNSALLFGPGGDLLGRYDKVHLTPGELAVGVVPGSGPTVVDTPIGRLGFSVCFDLNWPGEWASMAAEDVDVVVFISAYEGGFPLQALAWQHRIHVVSSVWPYDARIIDPLGRVVASTSRWTRVAVHDIDLDARIFHINEQIEAFERLAADYAGRLEVTTTTDEHLVIVSRRDRDIDLDEIIDRYRLVELDDFLAGLTPSPEAAVR